MLTSLFPSRSIFATAREMGEMLSAELHGKFKGPGWYLMRAPTAPEGKHWVLVLPTPDNPFNKEHPLRSGGSWPPSSGFVAHIYTKCPDSLFNAIANAPTRIDEFEGWECG